MTHPDATDKKLLLKFGIASLLLGILLVFLHPAINEAQWMVLTVLLAFASGGFGAALPGSIVTNAPGFAKATGGAGFFIAVLLVGVELVPNNRKMEGPASTSTVTQNPEPTKGTEATDQLPSDAGKKLTASNGQQPPSFPKQEVPEVPTWLGNWNMNFEQQESDGSHWSVDYSIDVNQNNPLNSYAGTITYLEYSRPKDSNETSLICKVVWQMTLLTTDDPDKLNVNASLFSKSGRRCVGQNLAGFAGSLTRVNNGGGKGYLVSVGYDDPADDKLNLGHYTLE